MDVIRCELYKNFSRCKCQPIYFIYTYAFKEMLNIKWELTFLHKHTSTGSAVQFSCNRRKFVAALHVETHLKRNRDVG